MFPQRCFHGAIVHQSIFCNARAVEAEQLSLFSTCLSNGQREDRSGAKDRWARPDDLFHIAEGPVEVEASRPNLLLKPHARSMPCALG